MKITIPQIRDVYRILTKVIDCREESRESWMEESEDKIPMGSLRFGPAGLPYPLNSVSCSVKRFDTFYSVNAVISAKKRRVFRNSSQGLNEKFESLGYEFKQTNKHGAGHLEKEGKTWYSIFVPGESKGLIRVLSAGDFGSFLRILEDPIDFGKDFQAVQTFLNLYLNHIIDLNAISGFSSLGIDLNL
jgi:hypothetical protein